MSPTLETVLNAIRDRTIALQAQRDTATNLSRMALADIKLDEYRMLTELLTVRLNA